MTPRPDIRTFVPLPYWTHMSLTTHQLIVATDVEAQASDQGQLLPLLADAGYCNEAVLFLAFSR